MHFKYIHGNLVLMCFLQVCELHCYCNKMVKSNRTNELVLTWQGQHNRTCRTSFCCCKADQLRDVDVCLKSFIVSI